MQALAERATGDVGHHVVEKLAGLAGFMHGQDVRVGEPRDDLDLFQEPLGAERGGELGPQHFERDDAVMLLVIGEVDRGHAAAAKQVAELITVRESSGEVGGDEGGHAVI